MLVYHKKWCVYTHSSNGVIFYVGSGECCRPFDYRNRKNIWSDFVKGLDHFDVDIVSWYTELSEARQVEIDMIVALRPSCNIFHNRGLKATRKPCSEEKKVKLRVNGRAKRIICLNNGVEYLSGAHAARELGIANRSGPTTSARGATKTCCGYRFVYKGEASPLIGVN